MPDITPRNHPEREPEQRMEQNDLRRRLAAAGGAGMLATPEETAQQRPLPPPAEPKRGWFRKGGRSAEQEAVYAPIDARLRALNDTYGGEADLDPGAAQEPAARTPTPQAELVFTTGPRAGERLMLEGTRIALDRDANETLDNTRSGMMASIWAQGEHFMLRHGGAILIDGARPALSIVVLEDGDELAWGAHRLQFRNAHAIGR